jgi:hypothetical protein
MITGGLAQMVERSLSMREVAGSIPASSTFLFGWFFFFASGFSLLSLPSPLLSSLFSRSLRRLLAIPDDGIIGGVRSCITSHTAQLPCSTDRQQVLRSQRRAGSREADSASCTQPGVHYIVHSEAFVFHSLPLTTPGPSCPPRIAPLRYPPLRYIHICRATGPQQRCSGRSGRFSEG